MSFFNNLDKFKQDKIQDSTYKSYPKLNLNLFINQKLSLIYSLSDHLLKFSTMI
jgi:hypothetical protein